MEAEGELECSRCSCGQWEAGKPLCEHRKESGRIEKEEFD